MLAWCLCTGLHDPQVRGRRLRRRLRRGDYWLKVRILWYISVRVLEARRSGARLASRWCCPWNIRASRGATWGSRWSSACAQGLVVSIFYGHVNHLMVVGDPGGSAAARPSTQAGVGLQLGRQGERQLGRDWLVPRTVADMGQAVAGSQ